ncbi:MAG: hypothetical protein E7621_02660 [Ruminococcaceae bacterium]|nr:hypothetical protein [Oscillospiraceae bacterium]
MKNRFARLMSVLLCVCMILSTFGFSVVAEDQAVAEYYVQKGATGDGRSEASPAGSIADVIAAINADGHTTGDEVTVYVIDSGEAAICEDGDVIASDIVLGYSNGIDAGNAPVSITHEATIRYTSYSDEARSVIAHRNWEENSWSGHLKVCGPTIFDNIAILEMRNTHDSMTDLVLNRFSVEFNNVIYYTLGTDNSVSLAVDGNGAGKAHLGIGASRFNDTYAGNQEVVIEDASVFKDISILGYTDAGQTQTLDGDITLRINGGAINDLKITTSAGNEIVKGDMNIILSGNTSINNFVVDGGVRPVVEGTMQIIVNPGVSIPGYISFFYPASSIEKTGDTERYVLYAKGDFDLDITDEAGTFVSDKETVLYVTADNGRTVYYGDGTITLPAGDYEVYGAASLDEVKAAVNPKAPAPLKEFDGWTDNGNGILTANFKDRDAIHAEYYVQHAGNGDGLTAETPVATVADAIALINDAGLGEGDTAEIFVMNDDSELGDKPFYMYSETGEDMEYWNFNGKDVRGRLTAWAWDGGIVEAYKAKVTITGYTDDAYLAYSTRIGHNTNMILNGPTEFKNLTIVATRSADRELFTNGYDTTFTNVKFAYETADEYSDRVYEGIWDGQMRVMLGGSDGVYQNNWDTVDGKGGKVVFDSPIDNYGGPYGLVLIGMQNEHTEYENPVTIYLNGASENGSIVWGTGSAKTYAPFSIVVNNGTYENKVYDTANFNAEGGIQVIANNGTAPIEIPEIVYGDKWTLTTKDADITLDVTETAGTFTVEGGKIAYAVAEDSLTVYYSDDSVLTVPAGTYDVYSAESLDEIKAEAAEIIVPEGWHVVSWEASGNTITAKLEATAAEENTYYVQFGGSGDGLTPETPVSTVADAVALINAAGLTADDTAYIYIMNDTSLTEDQLNGYPFFWYDADGNLIKDWNFNQWNGGPVDHRGRLTAWAWNGGIVEQHAAKIVVCGYTPDAYLFQSTKIGHNTNIILNGPTEFKDLTIVANRQYDREVFTNGYDTTFTNVAFAYMTADEHADRYYDGIYSGHMRVLFTGNDGEDNGWNPVSGGGGTVIFNSPIENEGGIYGLNILGGDQYSEFETPVTVYLNGESENGSIVWGVGEAKVKGPLSIVINKGSYENKIHENNKTLWLSSSGGGAVQIIANNGTTPISVPSIVDEGRTDKIWILSSEDTNGNTIDVTETAGTFVVNSELDAVAKDTTSGGLTRSKDGILTLEAGTYTITYEEPVEELMTIYADGEYFGEYPKGKWVACPPPLADNRVHEFAGWAIDGEYFAWGDELKEFTGDTYLTSMWKVREGISVIFFDEANGNDENDGTTRETAVLTMDKAIELAGTEKKIAIVGTFTAASLPAHTGMITLMDDGFGSEIRITSSINTNGPLTLEYITINADDYKFINTNSEEFVVGKEVVAAPGTFGLATHINDENKNSERGEITIYSDALVYVGSNYNTDVRTTDGALVVIKDGNPEITFCADGYWREDLTYYGTTFTGKPVSIVKFGGNPTFTNKNSYLPTFETAVQFIANYATEVPELPEFNFAEGYGLYVLKTLYNDGWNYLEPTDTIGVFNIIGGMEAVATREDGKQYVSSEGVLTVAEPGTYEVEFVDEVFYINRGEEIEVYKDCTLDLTATPATAKDGKLFIGWSDVDGNAVTDFNLTAGTILKAQYVDLTEEDFGITGAQIRLKDTDVKQGLRFIVRKSAGLDALDISEYGSVIVPSLALGKGTLTLNGVYNYNGKDYAAKAVPAAKLFSKNDSYEEYTVCVTDIAKANYNKMFTVRGYIKYTDLNGVEKVLYTDYYATNIVNVAKAGIDAGDANSEYFQEIVDTVKETVKAKYAVSDVNTKTVPTNNLEDNSPVSIEGLPYFTDFYQLNGAGEGMIVSEITIETGKTDVEPLEIFQLSDTHFNYVNAQDFADNDEVIMSSYRGRKWLADGASVPNTVRSLEYASQGDFTVITGDVLDYLSWGAIELTRKYIFDTYPDTFVTLGNHDPSKFCQTDRNDVVDYTSREYKYQWLQDNWNHDVYYASTVLDDRLMIIQIDNGSDVFWENQIEPLTNDLATARANGYDVLLFYHIPLVTNNPDEISVTPIRRNDTGAYNYRGEGGAFIGNKEADWATWEVYDLIKTNADIIDGAFCGHMHSNYYTEIIGTNPDETEEHIIPQFVISGTPYDGGHVMKITVK